MRKKYINEVLFILGLVVLISPISTQAQLTRGAISGTVQDINGAIIPGATVKVTDSKTNISRETVTNDDGFYRIGAS